MGGERSATPLEPPAKRIRTEPEATPTIPPSTPTSRATTPGIQTLGPPASATPSPRSVSATHDMQRSSSDMILDSDGETTAPRSVNGTMDENMVRDNDVPSPERQPLAEPILESEEENPVVESHDEQVTEEDTPMPSVRDNDVPSPERQPLAEYGLEPQKENPTVESQDEQVTEDTPMPSVQDPSPVSRETTPNPFTASRIFLCSPVAPPPLARVTVVPDVGHLSFHPPPFHDTRGGFSTATSQTPQQESPTQKSYIFSPAEVRTLVASRGSDEGSGPNKLVFPLDWNFMNGITKWRNHKAGQG